MAAKVPKKFSVKKSLRKTTGISAQNDEELQPLKKHHKRKIMNKEERNRFVSY